MINNIKVKVYKLRPPFFEKKHFSYTKKFSKITEALEHIALCQMADVNFDNLMGYCKRDRRFFILDIQSKKKVPIRFHYIEPQEVSHFF